jgi:hypothetical protein
LAKLTVKGDRPKKIPAKIGRELSIRVHLLIYDTIGPHLFQESLANLAKLTVKGDRAKKIPTKIGRELSIRVHLPFNFPGNLRAIRTVGANFFNSAILFEE